MVVKRERLITKGPCKGSFKVIEVFCMVVRGWIHAIVKIHRNTHHKEQIILCVNEKKIMMDPGSQPVNNEPNCIAQVKITIYLHFVEGGQGAEELTKVTLGNGVLTGNCKAKDKKLYVNTVL